MPPGIQRRSLLLPPTSLPISSPSSLRQKRSSGIPSMRLSSLLQSRQSCGSVRQGERERAGKIWGSAVTWSIRWIVKQFSNREEGTKKYLRGVGWCRIKCMISERSFTPIFLLYQSFLLLGVGLQDSFYKKHLEKNIAYREFQEMKDNRTPSYTGRKMGGFCCFGKKQRKRNRQGK